MVIPPPCRRPIGETRCRSTTRRSSPKPAPSFDRYEAAIAGNDTAVLDDSFWADPRTVRFGTTEILYGIAAIRAFRASVARYAPRATRKVQITTFGQDFACTNLEYQRTDSGLIGRETKIMVRLPEVGWKVVSAHVSLLANTDPGRVAKA